MAAGNIAGVKLSDVLVRMDRTWADNQVRPDFEGYVDSILAIQKESTANLAPIEGKKTLNMKVSWSNNSALTTAAVTDICAHTGPEATFGTKTLTIAKSRVAAFSISENELRTTDYEVENLVATNLMQASKALDEYIAQQAVVFADASKGTNAYPGIGTFATGVTSITAANWNAALFGHLTLTAKKNKMANPFLLSGTNLWTEWWNSTQNASNGEGKGADNMFKSLRKYFDVYNVDLVNGANLNTYMIDRGAIAFAKQNFYDMAPRDYGSDVGQRWSMESKNIPGLMFDVHYITKCVANEIKHYFEVYTYFDFFLNPLGADATRTGVLCFKKV